VLRPIPGSRTVRVPQPCRTVPRIECLGDLLVGPIQPSRVGGVVVMPLTKDQIKESPKYDPDQLDEGYRTRLGTYYDPYLH
jgi:hypothetical protein